MYNIQFKNKDALRLPVLINTYDSEPGNLSYWPISLEHPPETMYKYHR